MMPFRAEARFVGSARRVGDRFVAPILAVTVSDAWITAVALCVVAGSGNFSLEVASCGTCVIDPPALFVGQKWRRRNAVPDLEPAL